MPRTKPPTSPDKTGFGSPGFQPVRSDPSQDGWATRGCATNDHTPGKSRYVPTFAEPDSPLERALQTIEDPYGLQELAHFSIEELVAAAERALRYSTVAMIQAGRIYHAIKERLDFGTWEQFVIDHDWSFVYVRGCMKLVEVVAKHPQAAHLPPGRATERLLHMPMSRIDEVLIELPEAAIKKLTPWDLQKIYEEKRKKPRPPREYPPVELPTDLELLCTQAFVAFRQLEVLALPAREWPLAKEWCARLSSAWDRAAYNLYDPEHQTVPPWELGNSDDITEDP